jgi:hypothetical protein
MQTLVDFIVSELVGGAIAYVTENSELLIKDI